MKYILLLFIVRGAPNRVLRAQSMIAKASAGIEGSIRPTGSLPTTDMTEKQEIVTTTGLEPALEAGYTWRGLGFPDWETHKETR
jgi:hypothetical protein